MRLLVYEYCCVQSDADPVGRSLLHEGWGMLHALVTDLARAGTFHLTVLASPVLDSPLRQYPNVEVVVTRPDTDIETLATYAAKVDACLVIAPEFNGILLQRVAAVTNAGGNSLNCTLETIRLTANKLGGVEQFPNMVRHPVPFPPTVLWSPELVWQAFPAVLKPIDGAGSQATYLVRDPDELRRAAHEANEQGWTELVVQSYLGGVAASVCLLAGRHRQICPPTEQILSDDGRLHYLGARYPLADDLRHQADGLLRDLNRWDCPGLRGWVGCDVNLCDDRAQPHPGRTFFDINPRLTTSYLALRHRCRDNLGAAMVRIALGEELPPLQWDRSPLEFRIA